MMNTRIVMLGVALGLSIFVEHAYSQNTTNSSGKPVDIPIKSGPVPGSNPNRHKAPSKYEVKAVYFDTSHRIVFSLTDDIMYMSVEVENIMSGETHYGNVDASYPVMDVYLEPSSYTITCTSDDGSLYYGEFEID